MVLKVKDYMQNVLNVEPLQKKFIWMQMEFKFLMKENYYMI